MARMATNGKFQIPRHIELLNRTLIDIEQRRIEGVLISMPPRHGKSHLVSWHFPPWYLMNNPEHRILFLSHNATFARSWGRKSRDVFAVLAPQLVGLNVRQDSAAADEWNIHARLGGMTTTGVGGGITGKGADLVVVDDMVKNHEEALSKSFREKAWELWMSCVETRAEPGCVFVVVGTRWHEDDPMGRLQREIVAGYRKNWRIVSLPALAEEDEVDPLSRKPGEALWPERWPVEVLLEKKSRWDGDEAKLGPYWWHALYQQRPTPREGGIFKRAWIKSFVVDDGGIYRLEDGRAFDSKKCWSFMSVDLAVSEKETADYFCAGVWVVTPQSDLLLIDCFHERIQGPDQADVLIRMCTQWGPYFVAIESNQYQLSLFQDCVRKGIPAKERRSETDKVARSQLAATRMSAGKIFFRQGAAWQLPLIDELLVFPRGKNDDFVDVISSAAIEAAECVMSNLG